MVIWVIGVVILGPAVIGFNGTEMQYDRRQIICSRTYYVETGPELSPQKCFLLTPNIHLLF